MLTAITNLAFSVLGWEPCSNMPRRYLQPGTAVRHRSHSPGRPVRNWPAPDTRPPPSRRPQLRPRSSSLVMRLRSSRTEHHRPATSQASEMASIAVATQPPGRRAIHRVVGRRSARSSAGHPDAQVRALSSTLVQRSLSRGSVVRAPKQVLCRHRHRAPFDGGHCCTSSAQSTATRASTTPMRPSSLLFMSMRWCGANQNVLMSLAVAASSLA